MRGWLKVRKARSRSSAATVDFKRGLQDGRGSHSELRNVRLAVSFPFVRKIFHQQIPLSNIAGLKDLVADESWCLLVAGQTPGCTQPVFPSHQGQHRYTSSRSL